MNMRRILLVGMSFIAVSACSSTTDRSTSSLSMVGSERAHRICQSYGYGDRLGTAPVQSGSMSGPSRSGQGSIEYRRCLERVDRGLQDMREQELKKEL